MQLLKSVLVPWGVASRHDPAAYCLLMHSCAECMWGCLNSSQGLGTIHLKQYYTTLNILWLSPKNPGNRQLLRVLRVVSRPFFSLQNYNSPEWFSSQSLFLGDSSSDFWEGNRCLLLMHFQQFSPLPSPCLWRKGPHSCHCHLLGCRPALWRQEEQNCLYGFNEEVTFLLISYLIPWVNEWRWW